MSVISESKNNKLEAWISNNSYLNTKKTAVVTVALAAISITVAAIGLTTGSLTAIAVVPLTAFGAILLVITAVAAIILIKRKKNTFNLKTTSSTNKPVQPTLISPKRTEFQTLIKTNQAGCSGQVDSTSVQNNIDLLNKNSPKNIKFEYQETSEKNKIAGGTCSAMSLTFIQKIINNIDSETTLEDLTFRITGVVEQHLKTSNQVFRNQQSALNQCAVVDLTQDLNKAKKEQIEAISSLYKLKVQSCSPHKKIAQLNKGWLNTCALQDGVYLVRSWKDQKNYKLEAHGHSTVFIKKGAAGIHYDPNYGAKLFSSDANTLEEEFKSDLLRNNQSFTLPCFCFYKMSNT